MPKDRFYGLPNDYRIAILNGDRESIPVELLPLAEEWLANLKQAQGQPQVKTEELDQDGED